MKVFMVPSLGDESAGQAARLLGAASETPALAGLLGR